MILMGTYLVMWKESSSVISYSIFFLSNKLLNWCRDVCLQNLKSRIILIFKKSPLWKPGIFVAGSSGSEWHILAQRAGKRQLGLQLLAQLYCSLGWTYWQQLLTLTFSLLNVNMAHEAASSLPACLPSCLPYQQVKSTSRDIMDLTQVWHITFHFTGKERLRYDS